MTKYQLLDKLKDVLEQYDIESVKDDLSVSMHITFSSVGPGYNLLKEELWWDENLQLFIPEHPL
jgi:hypothetical protein